MTPFQFYFSLILTTLLVLITAWFSYNKERSKADLAVLGIAIVGAVLSFCTGSAAYQESKRNADSASVWNSRYVQLQNRTLDTATAIIDSLNIAIDTSRSLIKGNNKILFGQKTSLQKLDKQLTLSIGIQKSVNSSSKKLITTVDNATKTLNDNLTGGDGYCEAIIIPDGTGSGEFNIANLSDIPIPNVGVYFNNYSRDLNCPHTYFKGQLVLDSACTSKNAGELTIPKINRLDTVRIYGSNLVVGNITKVTKFTIRFNLPNKLYWQLLMVQTQGHHITWMSVLLTVQGNKRKIFHYNSLGAKQTNWDKEFDRPLQIYNSSHIESLKDN